MSTVTIDKAAPTRKVKYGSMSRDRTWALRWSYFFLTMFAIFSLVPPIYMLITSLKSSAEISAATNPWWVFHPTLDELHRAPDVEPVPAVLLEFRAGLDLRRHHHHADQRTGGLRTGADEVLGLGDARDRRLPDLPDPRHAAVHSLFKMFALFGDWTGIQLINRWYVLLIVYPTLTVPFCTWIMIGYFASIPKELERPPSSTAHHGFRH